MTSPRIALIHATHASAGPAHEAFAAEFPDARLWNLLDDQLIVEAEAAGGLTEPLRGRMKTLIEYARQAGADAVLLTCSMYGPVTRELRAGIPVLASDQALFDEVAARDPKRVAVLGPVRTGVDDTAARLTEQVPEPLVTGHVIDGARAATTAGDRDALNRCVRDAVLAVQDDTDLIVLGQFSISPAQPAAQQAVSVPILSPPHLAARRLRRHFTEAGT